jgi:hypothetical protein
MSDDDLNAELERLRKENAALKKEASSSIRMKVSEKGALSIYGSSNKRPNLVRHVQQLQPLFLVQCHGKAVAHGSGVFPCKISTAPCCADTP